MGDQKNKGDKTAGDLLLELVFQQDDTLDILLAPHPLEPDYQLVHYQNIYEDSELPSEIKLSVIAQAVRYCGKHDLTLPTWLQDAVCDPIERTVVHKECNSFDDAYDYHPAGPMRTKNQALRRKAFVNCFDEITQSMRAKKPPRWTELAEREGMSANRLRSAWSQTIVEGLLHGILAGGKPEDFKAITRFWIRDPSASKAWNDALSEYFSKTTPHS